MLLALGSRGDVQPMVALGRELAGREVSVTVVALRDYAGLAQGLDFVPIDRSMSESLQGIKNRDAGGSVANSRAIAHWLAEIAPQVVAAELAAVRPGDLVVAGVLTCDDAAALREITGCRVVNAMFAPLVPTISGRSGVVGPLHHSTSRVNRLAGTLGLAAAAGMCTTSGRVLRAGHSLPRTSASGFVRLIRDTPTLMAMSPVLVPPAPDWPDHVWQTGAWLAPEPEWQPPDALSAFLSAGPPPVFVTFGSAPGPDQRAEIDLVARAAVLAGQRAVIGSAATGLPELPDVHVLADAPHRWLLPRMAAVVHHGGAGTTTEALLAGVPNVAATLGADQPFFGRRIHELGAGPAPVRRPTLTAERLAALMTDLTGDHAAGYRTAAGAARDRMLTEGGVRVAADRLHTMLAASA